MVNNFHLNDHTLGFRSQTQKLEQLTISWEVSRGSCGRVAACCSSVESPVEIIPSFLGKPAPRFTVEVAVHW